MRFVQLGEQLAAGDFRVTSNLATWKEIIDRSPFAAHDHALMTRRKKTVRPVDRPARRKTSRVRDHHIRGQIFRLAAKPIRQPSPENRKSVQPKACALLKCCRRMIRRLGK